MKTAISTATTITKDSTAFEKKQIQISRIDSAIQSLETKTITVDSLNLSFSDIYFSKPDSTGQQYIERITTTDATRVRSILTTITGQSKTIEITKLDAASDIQTHVENTEKTRSKTKIKEMPITKWPLIIVVIGVLIAGFFVLKRFKIL